MEGEEGGEEGEEEEEEGEEEEERRGLIVEDVNLNFDFLFPTAGRERVEKKKRGREGGMKLNLKSKNIKNIHTP